MQTRLPLTSPKCNAAHAAQVSVKLRTLKEQPRLQEIIGRISDVPGVEEFRGIPYGLVPGRWQHSVIRKELPSEVFYAVRNGLSSPQY